VASKQQSMLFSKLKKRGEAARKDFTQSTSAKKTNLNIAYVL